MLAIQKYLHIGLRGYTGLAYRDLFLREGGYCRECTTRFAEEQY